MAHSICGHYHLFSLRNCHRELPECLHHADTGGAVHCAARVALPALQGANQTVRQRADPELDPSEGKMPGMRATDFTDVPESYLGYGVTQETFKWLFFSCLIIVLTITDLRVRMIPDAVTWPGFGAGLTFSAFLPPDDGVALLLFWKLPHWAHRDFVFGLLSAFLGAAFGSLFLWGAGAFYKFLRGREGLGLGDVKMMAMVGTFMGLRATFLTILVGTFLGSVIGLSVVTALYAGGWRRRLAERGSRRGLGGVSSLRWAIASQYQLPLGTFLGIAALLVVQVAPIISRWRPFII
jgi:hypothetical protein